MALPRVLFLCIGNSCRSQMAEGFARTYGSDVMTPLSAGIAPAMGIAPLTLKTMREKNIDLAEAWPKGLDDAVIGGGMDLVVNMTGRKLPFALNAPVEDWPVRDPIGEKEPVFRAVAEEIEHLVMRLVLRMRAERSKSDGELPQELAKPRI